MQRAGRPGATPRARWGWFIVIVLVALTLLARQLGRLRVNGTVVLTALGLLCFVTIAFVERVIRRVQLADDQVRPFSRIHPQAARRHRERACLALLARPARGAHTAPPATPLL
jgi:hypothetical protein